MFCGKCGAKLEDNVKFCTACGAKVNAKSETPAAGKNRKVGLIAVAVIAVVAVVAVIAIILSVSVFGGGYKKIADRYVEAYLESDGEAMLELLPEKAIEGILDRNGYDKDELDDMIDELEDGMEFEKEHSLELLLEEDAKISYELAYSELPEDEFEGIYESHREKYGVKISEAKWVDVEFTIRIDGEIEHDWYGMRVVKVGGSWYADPGFINFLVQTY